MQFGTLLRLHRVVLPFVQITALPPLATNSFKILGNQCLQQQQRHKHAVPIAQKPIVLSVLPKHLTFLQRMLMKLGLKQSRLLAIAYLSYEHMIDNVIDYETFYKVLNMPDTMFSWFLVTELYVWMLMVRYMVEGEDGKILRDHLAEEMWEDVKQRVDKLGYIKRKIKRNQIMELNAQFSAAIACYDEGMLSDDKVLANALWRRLGRSECDDPEVLERLVVFVRRQLQVMDSIPREELFTQPQLKWINFKSIQIDRRL